MNVRDSRLAGTKLNETHRDRGTQCQRHVRSEAQAKAEALRIVDGEPWQRDDERERDGAERDDASCKLLRLEWT